MSGAVDPSTTAGTGVGTGTGAGSILITPANLLFCRGGIGSTAAAKAVQTIQGTRGGIVSKGG